MKERRRRRVHDEMLEELDKKHRCPVCDNRPCIKECKLAFRDAGWLTHQSNRLNVLNKKD